MGKYLLLGVSLLVCASIFGQVICSKIITYNTSIFNRNIEALSNTENEEIAIGYELGYIEYNNVQKKCCVRSNNLTKRCNVSQVGCIAITD